MGLNKIKWAANKKRKRQGLELLLYLSPKDKITGPSKSGDVTVEQGHGRIEKIDNADQKLETGTGSFYH